VFAVSVTIFQVLPEENYWLAKHPSGFSVKCISLEAALAYLREIATHMRPSEIVVLDEHNNVIKREKYD
jgi:hypothetical protein